MIAVYPNNDEERGVVPGAVFSAFVLVACLVIGFIAVAVAIIMEVEK